MKSNSANLNLSELASEVFGDVIGSSVKADGPNYIEFDYKGKRVRVNIWNDRKTEDHFGVNISDGVSEYMSVATLLAYYENKKCNLYCSKDNAIQRLKDAKRFIDEGKLIFEYVDLKESKRWIKIGETTKELPFIISGDNKKEMEIMFGEEAKRVLDNPPIYENPDNESKMSSFISQILNFFI